MKEVIISSKCNICIDIPIGAWVCSQNKCIICVNCMIQYGKMQSFDVTLCPCCQATVITSTCNEVVITKLPCNNYFTINNIKEYREHYTQCIPCLNHLVETFRSSESAYKKDLANERKDVTRLNSQVLACETHLEELRRRNAFLSKKIRTYRINRRGNHHNCEELKAKISILYHEKRDLHQTISNLSRQLMLKERQLYKLTGEKHPLCKALFTNNDSDSDKTELVVDE